MALRAPHLNAVRRLRPGPSAWLSCERWSGFEASELFLNPWPHEPDADADGDDDDDEDADDGDDDSHDQ